MNGCASTAPLPQPLSIVDPAKGTPPEIAAFSGVWEGMWNGALATYLVVEDININSAQIIVSLGITSYTPEGLYFYATTKVLPGPTLEWADPEGNIYNYKMDKSLKKVNAFMLEKATGAKFWAYLERKEIE